MTEASLGRWFRLWARAKLLSLVLLAGVGSLLFLLLQLFPNGWWIPMATGLFILGVCLARLGPTLLMPLFFPILPLGDADLEEKLQSFLTKEGLASTEIRRIEIGPWTRKANAAFAGLGKTRRILLADTLLDKFEQEEILAVVAHELAHQQLKHIGKGIGLGFLTTVVGLGLAANLYALLLPGFGFSAPSQLAALPLLGLLLTFWGLAMLPIQNMLMRRWEFHADAFAAQRTSPEAMASALERLAKQNLADPDPPWLEEILLHDHPSIRRRLNALIPETA